MQSWFSWKNRIKNSHQFQVKTAFKKTFAIGMSIFIDRTNAINEPWLGYLIVNYKKANIKQRQR